VPRNRDLSAAGQLFLKHSDQLERYLRKRLSSHDDAQELAQEAFLRLLRMNRDGYVRHPQAYLYRIARNLVHELYSGTAVDPLANAGDLETLQAVDLTPDEIVDQARKLKAIEKALAELPPKCQAVVLLSWQRGLTQQKIADHLHLSRSMVQKYLAKGLAHCRKRLVRSSD
jgi:RNA polymerase sigma-70 factor (ECF subfamily)